MFSFEVFRAARIKRTAFLDISPCSLIKVNLRFTGSYCLHYQGVSSLKLPFTSTSLNGAIFRLVSFSELLPVAVFEISYVKSLLLCQSFVSMLHISLLKTTSILIFIIIIIIIFGSTALRGPLPSSVASAS
jgi:hypothetical protein